MMYGYEEDKIFQYRSIVHNKTDLFPYIDFSKVSINAAEIFLDKNGKITYTLELLIKRKMYKLAEVYVNEAPYVDMAHCLKYNSKLLKNPSKNRLDWANHTNLKYQRGMLQYKYYTIESLLKHISWNDLQAYIKEQFKLTKTKSKEMIVDDYDDYLQKYKQYRLPKKPKDLYYAKDILRDLENEKIVAIESKKYDKLIKSLKLPSVSNKTHLIRPIKDVKEMMDEGNKLGHCIYQYREQYAKGQTHIYTIRSHEDINKPICTVEIKQGECKQARGIYNQNLYTDYKFLINKLLKEVNNGN